MSQRRYGWPWPPVGYEELPWVIGRDVPSSRSARRRHAGPYEAAVPAEIAGKEVDCPSALGAEAEDAAAAIARFDAELGREIAPFGAVLLRTESAASSKIENLTASARAIAQAELGGHGGLNAALIVANERAMRASIERADQINSTSILEMHKALLGDFEPSIAGRWRTEQVWIGGGDLGPHGALFVPPHHRRLAALIDDLVRFADRTDIPVLVQAAIAHAQFETLHPFADGNGRTGRALVHAQLRHAGLTRTVTVPVSAGLLTDTDAYFEALTAYRAGDAAPIVGQFIRAAFAAIGNGGRLVEELREIRSEWQGRMVARRDAVAWRVLDLVLRQPVLNAATIATHLEIAPQNVYRSIRQLELAGVLVEFSDKKRNQLWRSPEILAALDRFAARAGRRNRASG